MSDIQKNKIYGILKKYFGQEWVITNLDVVPLPNGENYCSNVFSVSATLVLDTSEDTKAIRAIAKSSVSEGLFETAFSKLYQREVYFYTRIIPSLKDFILKHSNMDIGNMFPEFYGCSEQPERVTTDSVILIEDMSPKGYEIVDRFIGYDYNQIKSVLKNIAFFHGTSLAMKIKEPSNFDSNIKTFCQINVFPKEAIDELWKTLPDFEQSDGNGSNLVLQILEDYQVTQQCIKKMADVLEKERLDLAGLKLHTVPGIEPFNTLIHNDLWINNIMHTIKDGRISAMRLIDFQMYRYNHPARDLMHVLFTSVRYDVLKEHFDDLIDFYYQELIATLVMMDCDISGFGKQQFFEDTKLSMGAIFGHMIFMILFVVFGRRKSENEHFEPPSMQVRKNDIPEEARKRLCFLVEQVFKRSWCTGIYDIERVLGTKIILLM